MNFYKSNVDHDKYELILEDNDQVMKMHYGGADFYWTMLDYTDDNNFNVTVDDGELFLDLNRIFIESKKLEPSFVVNDTIEWLSDAREAEVSSKVIIKKNDDSINIKFVRNPKDIFGMMSRGCFISFCMNGSSHQDVAYAFSRMFIKYRNLEVDGEKKLIK